MCFGSKPKTPPAPKAPVRNDPQIQERAEDESRLARKRKGKGATIITGGMGDSNYSRATGKTVLGV